MKILFCIAVAASTIFTSCKKDDEETTPESQPAAASMSATVDGNSWTAITRVNTINSGIISLAGTSVGGNVINININDNSVGTYNLANLNRCTFNEVKITGGTDSYISTGGTVTVTKVDMDNKLISGTFEFTAAKSGLTDKSITNGVFTNLKYTTTGEVNTSFEGDVDGRTINFSPAPTALIANESNGQIVINATESSISESVSLKINKSFAVDSTYGIGSGYLATYTLGTQAFVGTVGSVNLSLNDTVNKRMEGTYSFTGYLNPSSSVSLTNGKFSVNY